jgi:hypothetical protein
MQATINLSPAIALLLVVGTGCWSGSETDVLPGTPSKVGAGPVIELPVVTQSPDEIRTEMREHKPFSPQFEDARIKLLVALEKIRKREGVEGFQVSEAPQSRSPSAHVDPQTGRVAWRALCCFSPDSVGKGKGGGPLLFVQTFSHVNIGPDGKLVLSQPIASELKSPPCPGCGQLGFIRAYDPPETEIRRRQLNHRTAPAKCGGRDGGRAPGSANYEGARYPTQDLFGPGRGRKLNPANPHNMADKALFAAVIRNCQ